MTQRDLNDVNRIICKRFEFGIDEHIKESKGKKILLWAVLIFCTIFILAAIYAFIETIVIDQAQHPWKY